MDLSLMTEGTHYCKIEIPMRAQKNFWTGAIVEDSGGGNSFQLRFNRRGYSIPIIGWTTTLANANLIDKFLMSDRHTAGSSTTYYDYYMVVYFGVNLHLKFVDASNNQQSYCKGMVMNGHISWDMTKNLIFKFNGTFRSIW